MATPVMYTSRMVAPVHTVQAVPVQLQAAPHVEEELIETLETAEPVMVMKAVACCRMLGEVSSHSNLNPNPDQTWSAPNSDSNHIALRGQWPHRVCCKHWAMV